MKQKHPVICKLSVLLFAGVFLLALFQPFDVQANTSASTAGSSGDLKEIQKGDIILLGKPDESIGFSGEWIVLDANHTNTGEDGMFLLSKAAIGSDTQNGMLFRDIGDDIVVTFDNRGEAYAAEHPDVLNYQGSDIQKWCADFLTSHFSEAEQNALIKTYKSDDAYQKPIVFGGKNTSVDFDAAENILNGDQLFLLSAEEANNPDYGFTDDAKRLVTLNGKDAMWWLRSPHTPTYPLDVGMVFANGSIMDFPVNAQAGFSVKFLTCARPACNLDTAKINTVTKTGESDDGAAVWSLTLTDDSNASAQTKSSTYVILGAIAAGVVIIALILFLRKKKSK